MCRKSYMYFSLCDHGATVIYRCQQYLVGQKKKPAESERGFLGKLFGSRKKRDIPHRITETSEYRLQLCPYCEENTAEGSNIFVDIELRKKFEQAGTNKRRIPKPESSIELARQQASKAAKSYGWHAEEPGEPSNRNLPPELISSFLQLPGNSIGSLPPEAKHGTDRPSWEQASQCCLGPRTQIVAPRPQKGVRADFQHWERIGDQLIPLSPGSPPQKPLPAPPLAHSIPTRAQKSRRGYSGQKKVEPTQRHPRGEEIQVYLEDTCDTSREMASNQFNGQILENPALGTRAGRNQVPTQYPEKYNGSFASGVPSEPLPRKSAAARILADKGVPKNRPEDRWPLGSNAQLEIKTAQQTVCYEKSGAVPISPLTARISYAREDECTPELLPGTKFQPLKRSEHSNRARHPPQISRPRSDRPVRRSPALDAMIDDVENFWRSAEQGQETGPHRVPRRYKSHHDLRTQYLTAPYI